MVVMIYKNNIFSLALLTFWLCCADTTTTASNCVPLHVVSIGADDQVIHAIGSIVARDCSFSQQWCAQAMSRTNVPTKEEIRALGNEAIPLVLFLSMPSATTIEWRLYDTMHIAMMHAGQCSVVKTHPVIGTAHAIADSLWPILTNKPGFFSTKIAFCVEKKKKRSGKIIKTIWIADYDGNNPQQLVSSPTVNIAPRWNKDVANPLVFYSEYTDANVRMMVVDMKHRHRVASNFEGINMLPAFSPDGTQLVYCASHGDGVCHLYHATHQGLKEIVRNEGNNISPTFAQDSKTIFFCSDFQGGRPHIYSYNLDSGQLTSITESGYCTSPDYNAVRNQLVYTKMVNGNMQIFVYDVVQKKHTQLTHDAGSKQECCWSPCGNFLIFSLELQGKSRIAIHNMATNARRLVTPEHLMCSYPHWSGRYKEYPVIADVAKKRV